MKKGDIVIIKITGEIGMIVESLDSNTNNTGYCKGYFVRLPNYEIIKFFEYELNIRK